MRCPKPHDNSTLMERTKQLLSATEQSYTDIFLATQLKPHWLSLLATNRLKDPSVNKVQKLYEHLSGKQLLV